MVKTIHLCDICGTQFPNESLEQALEHENKPIKEGNYDGVVLSDLSRSKYYFFAKSEEVNTEHERLYFSNNLEIEYIWIGLQMENSKKTMSVSEIDTKLRTMILIPITEDEIKKLNYHLIEGKFAGYYPSSTTLRTVKEAPEYTPVSK